MLARWAQAVERHWTELDDAGHSSSAPKDSALGCYGPGYIHWGIQSNWNYSATVATLAAQPGIKRADHWRGRALIAACCDSKSQLLTAALWPVVR